MPFASLVDIGWMDATFLCSWLEKFEYGAEYMSENTYFRFIGLSHKDREQVISGKYFLDGVITCKQYYGYKCKQVKDMIFK